ncbi:MAG: gamma-glutamyl-gamma-aminobutyrate hydrolase family protein, partial [Planctomycetota bacterium]|nr:gamma-glutamyl-gamma-aminobutyrate hydrolase family protein [Planctomycetota bacterium]
NDLDPSLYCDENWHPEAAKSEPARQCFELALGAEVEKRRMPTLGVCLGSQVMNVYRGGSLIQFLPDEVKDIEHRCLDKSCPPRHAVKVDTESQLGRAIGKRDVSVNTYHKQAIRKIGRGLRVVATAPDGVIEGYEDPTYPLFAAVQWHPERLLDEAEHLAPFKLLVDRSRETARR